MHLSCLAQQAKISIGEIESEEFGSNWERWVKCRMCEQQFHGTVQCALGWACWKTYVCRPAEDLILPYAMNILGNGLSDDSVRRYEEAAQVYEAELAHTKRYDPHHTQALLAVRDNIASCLSEIGRHEEAQALLTDIFAETRDSFGLRDVDTLEAAYSLCTAMIGHEDYAGCVQFFREFNLIDATARVHGADHEIVLRTRRVYARALYSGENAPLSDVRQAVEILEEICPKTRQVLGPNHPRTSHCERLLMLAQEKLARAEAPVARRTRSKES